MEKEVKKVNYLKKIGRIVLKTILYIFLFVILVFLLVLTPPVQHFLTGKVQNYLQNKLHTKVLIGSISFGLSGKINLQNVYIEDKTRDTLISGGDIKAHINFLKIFSNEVQVKDIEFQNITAKIKRILPDTTFNFMFIVNAFTSENTKKSDTAKSAPMKLNISDIALDNVNITYKDVITGNDLFTHVGTLTAIIDTLDPYTPKLSIPTLIVRNVQMRLVQATPLITPQPLSVDIAKAAAPTSMKLYLGTIDLNKINIQYGNDVSAMYTIANIGQLKINGRLFDLQNNRIFLDQLALNNSKIDVRFGKPEVIKAAAKAVNQKVVAAQQTFGYDFRIAKLNLDNNSIVYNNDVSAHQAYGMDFNHMNAQNLTLEANKVVFRPDSTSINITKGNFKEKSGFQIDTLQGDILYAQKQAYIKDLYIKTPGSILRRSVVLNYPSIDALTKNPSKVSLDILLDNSRLQVKDILAFVPQLRNNPAMSNPNATWFVDVDGNGTLNRLTLRSLKFSGLSNTQLNAQGTLVNLMNPKVAGGNFTIYRFHTTQTDLALFNGGKKLSTPQMDLPQEFDISGTVIGNAGSLNTNLNLNTSDGYMGLNGRFSNLTDPNSITYNAQLRIRSLQIGKILRKQATMGSATGSITFNGHGASPKVINTNFHGLINNVGYNNYQYKNISLNGYLHKTAFLATTVIHDPNIYLNLTASGNFSSNPSFAVNGMIDSIKTLPLHLTTQPLIFRGQINATASNISSDNPDADLLITKGLFVSGPNRLPLDTLQLTTGKNDTASFIRFRSSIANALISGQYKIAELGNIIQNTLQPYFTTSTSPAVTHLQPYDFHFNIDVVYTPVLTSFVPGLTSMQPIHADGRFSSTNGMQAVLRAPYVNYNGDEITKLNINVNTSDSGLQVNGIVGHIKSGSSFDLYNTRIRATALHDNINFSVGVDDPASKNKYHLSGLFTQPSPGTYAVKLSPDSLLLNYKLWTVPADNELIIGKTAITAHDFTLQQGSQKLSLNSIGNAGTDQPLQINFTAFQLSTITGFIKADSVLVDGVMNGDVTLRNLMQTPVFTSNLTIDNLSMRKDTLGNVNIQVNNNTPNRYNTNITLTGRGNDVGLTGYFETAGKDINLNLDLAVRQLQLHSMEGAMASAITNASGAINGAVSIRGTSAKPAIKGDLNFDHASFALTALGSQFKIDNEKISVTENGLQFNNFTIKDSANNALAIDGTILTSNFVNYNFNLTVTADNFLVLNSAKAKGKLYYGRLNVSTNTHISGTEKQPVVDGSLTVNKGTNLSIVIPQAEPGIQDREGIVEFVDMRAPGNDSLFKSYDTINKANVTGMDITTNIVINKDAIFNVVIDEANGDFLNVRGSAQLSTGIDPSGKISMTGTYTVEEGAYQLAFNFIQRRFDIQKGSTIVWAGDPTSAQLNLTAVYVANTDPLDLVQDQVDGTSAAIRNTYLQKLPFEVHLVLTGELMKPAIGFDIILPEDKNYGVSNTIISDVESRLAQVRTNEGEMNKQVFSLLLLGRFVGQNPFASSGSGGGISSMAKASVSKLLTQQLNQLASGLINGVDLNFDVVSTDDYTTGERRDRTDLNVGVSKRLLSDRLKVTVGSDFELQGPTTGNQQNNNIAGNIAADYQLSRDGRYLLRFYRRNEYEGVIDGYIIETGLGFEISLDYNKFSEIFHRRKQRVTKHGNNQNQLSK